MAWTNVEVVHTRFDDVLDIGRPNPASAADGYSYTPFNVPGSGSTQAYGINNRGEIVGSDNTGAFGFLRSPKGNIIKFDLPGVNTFAFGINDLGQVVGGYGAIFQFHGYVRDADGEVRIIDVPGSKGAVVYGINNRGEMVGEYDDVSSIFHGFLRHSDGPFTTIDVPGAVQTILMGINIRGEIIGNYLDRRGNQPSFLLSPNGALTIISKTGAAQTNAYGLNDRGEIVGTTDAPAGGFLLSSDLTTFTPINVPVPGSATRPNGINNRGEIVGGLFSNQQSGFFAIPCRGPALGAEDQEKGKGGGGCRRGGDEADLIGGGLLE